MADVCSGIYCPFIYVFKENNKLWKLIKSSYARLQEQMEIEVDYKLRKIIFKKKSNQLGELPFETLNLSSDIEQLLLLYPD